MSRLRGRPRSIEKAVPVGRNRIKSTNKPAPGFWHRGFAVRLLGPDGAAVPFIREATAKRIAALAATRHGPMRVFEWHSGPESGWAYQPDESIGQES